MSSGWVKLHRSISDWEWIDDHAVVILWIHFLILANHEERIWRGEVIKPGQFVSSIASLSAKSKLTPKQVRGCITKLKRTGEVASQSTNEYTVFTLNSWEKYQSQETEGKLDGKRRASEGQAEGKRRATNKNDKNYKNEKEDSCLPTQAETLESRIKSFAESLGQFKEEYTREMLLEFYNYWTEPNRSRTKAKWEMEKTWDTKLRLATWASRQRNKPTKTFREIEQERIAANHAEIMQGLGVQTLDLGLGQLTGGVDVRAITGG